MSVEETFQQLLNTAYKGQSSDRSKDKNIHVYDLIDFCPRAFALCHQSKIPYHKKETLGLATAYTFHLGNRMEDLLVDLLKMQGILFGTFQCRIHTCKHRMLRYYKEGEGAMKCTKCGCTALKYVNTSLVLPFVPGIDIVGNIDTLPGIESESVFINDGKSIKKEAFDKLEEPVRWHKDQVNLYILLLKMGAKAKGEKIDKPRVTHDYSAITYLCKGYPKEKIPTKVFVVDPNRRLWADTKKALGSLKKFLLSKSKKPRLPTRICDNEACLMARDCVARMICFDHPFTKKL